MGKRWSVGWVFLAGWFCGCAHGGEQVPPAEQIEVSLGRRCRELTADRAASAIAFRRVFVEVADITHTDLNASTPAILQHQPFLTTHLAVSHTIVTNRRQGTVTLPCAPDGDCADSEASDSWVLALIPRLPKYASDPIRFTSLRLLQSDPESPKAQGVTLNAIDQQPAIVAVPTSTPGRVSWLSITPYLIDSDMDLEALMECKRRDQAQLTAESASLFGSAPRP